MNKYTYFTQCGLVDMKFSAPCILCGAQTQRKLKYLNFLWIIHVGTLHMNGARSIAYMKPVMVLRRTNWIKFSGTRHHLKHIFAITDSSASIHSKLSIHLYKSVSSSRNVCFPALDSQAQEQQWRIDVEKTLQFLSIPIEMNSSPLEYSKSRIILTIYRLWHFMYNLSEFMWILMCDSLLSRFFVLMRGPHETSQQ